MKNGHRFRYKIVFKILIIPYFLLWLWNVKIPVGSDPTYIYLSFLYSYIASLVIIAILILHNFALKKSSAFSVVLVIFLLIPTIWYQISGLSDAVIFDHISGFPVGPILKITLILLAFVSFNELLARNYISLDFLVKIFVISMLISIPKYLFENYELILNLDVHSNRPYPEWIGGWNTYGFLLGLAFMIIYKSVSLARFAKYSLLVLIFVVMMSTLSRSGMLALLVALFLDWRGNIGSAKSDHEGRKFIIVIVIIFVAVGGAILAGLGEAIYDRFVISFTEPQYEGTDYLQSVSSARNVLWLDTLSKFTNVDHYYQWLSGYGVGHYAYVTDYGVESDMGNQYVLFIYEYGLIIGVGLSVLMFRAYSILRWRCDLAWARTAKAMFAMYLVANFSEELIYTTQVGWLIGIGAAIVLHVLRSDRMRLARLIFFGRGTASSRNIPMKIK